MTCKHPGCNKQAIIYQQDGITVVACKKHFDILVNYLQRELLKEKHEKNFA